MPLQPNCCIACGNTPIDEDGPKDAYFAEAVDVNWGDSLYLCDSCVRIVGLLRGMIDVEDAQKLERELKEVQAKHEELMEEHDSLNEKVRRMVDGARAKREAKEQVKK